MTVKSWQKRPSELILGSIKDVVTSSTQAEQKQNDNNLNKELEEKLPPMVLDLWASLPQSVRSALVTSELDQTSNASSLSCSVDNSSSKKISNQSLYPSSATLNTARSSSAISSECKSDDDYATSFEEKEEECPLTGANIVLRPIERAPENVFSFTKTSTHETSDVIRKGSSIITTSTKVVTSGRGWRNVFTLPISYDVNIVAEGTILDASNPQLLHATGVHPEGYNQRFAVIDADVDNIYGKRIRAYFSAQGIKLTTCVLNGGEIEKRPDAVDKILDELCSYKLRRREPFLAIGGGVILDIAGMAACVYRRGVPFVRVPTTLLAIVDASVGVKNGVDYCCDVTNESYKNRVGSFYAPSSCLLDASFISSQDKRNIANGFGEIVKLALVRSSDLFELLESHGAALIKSNFATGDAFGVPTGVAERIIEASIQIMLEELGPNLWESKLERCVDYGHTFSKLLEMVPGADIMHGEAVNVDGFFCVVLSHLRGYISMDIVSRIFKCMQVLNLPTDSIDLTPTLAWQSCKDAIEHRHGEQRIPLITEIGESICVSDITEDELKRAVHFMKQFDHRDELSQYKSS